MKKRIVIGIFLLLFACAVSILSLCITNMICTDIQDTVDQTETFILGGQTEKAKDQALALSDNWERQYQILSSYIDHQHLERCEVAISAVYKYLSLDDYAAALVMCQDIRVSSEHIYSSEWPSLWNIF